MPAIVGIFVAFAASASADDVATSEVSAARRSDVPKQTLIAELTPEKRVQLRLGTEPEDAGPDALPALLFDATEIAERKASPDEARESGRVVELQSDVRLQLRDGTVNARADRAVVVVGNQSGIPPFNMPPVDKLTVKLLGNVNWNAGGVASSADELRVIIQPAAREPKPVLRASEMEFRGQARFSTADLSAKADRIQLEFEPTTKRAAGIASHILLEGNAEFSWSKKPGARRSMLSGERMEFWPDR